MTSENLIHFVNPISGETLCRRQGDARWIGIRVSKEKVCPVCWRLRSVHNTLKREKWKHTAAGHRARR